MLPPLKVSSPKPPPDAPAVVKHALLASQQGSSAATPQSQPQPQSQSQPLAGQLRFCCKLWLERTHGLGATPSWLHLLHPFDLTDRGRSWPSHSASSVTRHAPPLPLPQRTQTAITTGNTSLPCLQPYHSALPTIANNHHHAPRTHLPQRPHP